MPVSVIMGSQGAATIELTGVYATCDVHICARCAWRRVRSAYISIHDHCRHFLDFEAKSLKYRYRSLWAHKVPQPCNRRVFRQHGTFIYEHDAPGAAWGAPTSQLMTIIDHFLTLMLSHRSAGIGHYGLTSCRHYTIDGCLGNIGRI